MPCRYLVALLVAPLVALAAAAPSLAQQSFNIVAIPDTQFYCEGTLGPGENFFDQQTQWIVDNALRHNIVFATHLGDVVDNAGEVGLPRLDEWIDAVRAMNILRNSTIPHSILPGNHDWTSSTGTGSLEHYRVRFGDTSGYFDAKPWHLGYDPRGGSCAQRFSTPIGEFLHIALEWNASIAAVSSDRPGATGTALGWAQSVIDAHPDMPTIVSTHNHVNASSVRDGAGNLLFQRFTRGNNQIFLILNGHYHGEGRVYSYNDVGRPVYEINSDYQSRNRGGDGWLRLMTFEPGANRIRVRTYTPIGDAVDGAPTGAEFGGIGRIETDANSQFDLPLDFATRFLPPAAGEPAPPTPPGQGFMIKNGVAGYFGTVDTEVRSAAAGTTFATQGYMHIDSDDGTPAGPSHGLIRFDGIFGSGVNQVGADDDVLGATLRLYVHEQRSNSEGAGLDVRRLLVPFSNASTWNSFSIPQAVGGGPIVGWGARGSNGFGALASPDGEAGANGLGGRAEVLAGRYLSFDVTRAVRAWKNGQAAHGWIIQPKPNCTNAIRVETSESTLTGARFPELIITRTLSPTQVRTFTQGFDTELDQSRPSTLLSTGATLAVDASVEDNSNAGGSDVQALLRFTDVFGVAATQVPEGALISSAVLTLNVNTNVSFHDGGGFSAHRMLRPWAPTATWNLMAGGVSFDNAEAAATADDTGGQDVLSSAIVQAGAYLLDVTDSVRRWSAGGGNAANFGWVIVPLPNATNAVIFDSFEAAGTGSARPRLTVRFVCPADYNGQGGLTVQDIFDFLAGYFANDDRADINRDGMVSVQDIFDFLARYFRGC